MSTFPGVYRRVAAVCRSTGSVTGVAAFCVAGVTSPAPAGAQNFGVGDIGIERPWSRATPPGATTGAGYFGLSNQGSTADRLIGASSPAVPKVEVHQMSVEDGIMKMKPVEGGIEIPAGGSVALAPGGYHLMLMGLTKPLVRGEKVPVTLTFEKAGRIEVDLEVGSMGAKAPPHVAESPDAADGAK